MLLIQCILYDKAQFLTSLLLLILQTHNSDNPDLPIVIQTRIIAVQDLYSAFIEGICGKCGEGSPTCNQNLDYLKTNPYVKFSADAIIDNPDKITEAISIIDNVNGDYTFPGLTLDNANMQYTLYLPVTQEIKGVILYNHQTIFGREQIPTIQDIETSAIAALYVSSGYAIVFPNYLGYKEGSESPPPYLLHPRQNVEASVLALNQAIKDIKKNYPSINQFPLFAVGYSQGASYALWLEKCLQDLNSCQNVKLDSAYIFKGAAGLNGPYDLLKSVKSFLTDKVSSKDTNTYNIENQTNTNLDKPARLAMTLISYIYYNRDSDDYQKQMESGFWNMQCSWPISKAKCQVGDVQYESLLGAVKSFKKSIDVAQSIAFSAFGKSYSNAKKETYLGRFTHEYTRGDRNSVYGLASQGLINEKQFEQALVNASAINNEPQSKVFLFSLKRDSVVPVINTEDFESKYGSSKVEAYYFDNENHKVCEGEQGETAVLVDHNSAQILANVFALAFIKSVNEV